uniref:Uncharacterized protein n=1 Tax=Candidatus Kentrum sp. LPFa TaxID=2126335 RepID=A0A450XHA7_9GAMM|nr:MAG: hypothetical protein BECKLPF1236A_GA0070988_100884 [Candidatus Kentron sp. LPFa]VFK28624.1 MAG: hypothetical protein BECKLPF1236C_GA0070990_100704 [Candidatus Kentron sp. LPFa]
MTVPDFFDRFIEDFPDNGINIIRPNQNQDSIIKEDCHLDCRERAVRSKFHQNKKIFRIAKNDNQNNSEASLELDPFVKLSRKSAS